MIIWRFTDGKRGHENQTRGLVRALTQLIATDTHDIAVVTGLRGSVNAFLGGSSRTSSLPDPQILLGAGHATHLPMLTAARARGGRTVVLMKPTLPMRWFDLCVVPEHDGVQSRSNVLITRGVLNRMTNRREKETGRGVILVGGPSKHHAWDEGALRKQLEAVLTDAEQRAWTITTSRRTPESTVQMLEQAERLGARLVAYGDADESWLPTQLARAEAAWVTEDSVSMVYECLTAGAATGLLPVPRHANDRLSRGVDRLIAEGLVTAFPAWRGGHALRRPETEFNEAARCAQWLFDHWLRR